MKVEIIVKRDGDTVIEYGPAEMTDANWDKLEKALSEEWWSDIVAADDGSGTATGTSYT